jgi:hypothetical protein
MCVEIPGQPYRIVLDRQHARNGSMIETYTYALGKITSRTRSGDHTSNNNFTWQIGRTVHDSNAVIGDHNRCLHFFPNLEPANALNSYTSHRLVALPAPHLWDDPIERSFRLPRCWHSSGASTLFCVDCFGYHPDDLKNPAFWQDLMKPRMQSYLPPATNDDIVLAIPRSAYWHRQVQVSTNKSTQYALSGERL